MANNNGMTPLIILAGGAVALGLILRRRATQPSTAGIPTYQSTLGAPSRTPALGSGFYGVGRVEVFPVTPESSNQVAENTAEMLMETDTSAAVEILAERLLQAKDLTFEPTPAAARELHRFVNETLPTTPDPPNFEQMTSPDDVARMILQGGGVPDYFDCDDKAMLLASLYRSVGFEASVVLLDTNGDGIIDHAMTVVRVPGEGELFAETTIPGKALGWKPEFQSVTLLVT